MAYQPREAIKKKDKLWPKLWQAQVQFNVESDLVGLRIIKFSLDKQINSLS